MKEKVLEFITVIRESFIGSVTVYTMGSCYWFYLILKQVFPEAEAYTNNNHIISKIGDSFYDIRGEIFEEDVDGFYIPFIVGDYSEETAKSYRFDIFKQ